MSIVEYTPKLYERIVRHRPWRFCIDCRPVEEKDANLIAIDPGELAAPVRVSDSRKQQEKFLEGKTFDRAVDGQSSAGLRYILQVQGRSTVDASCWRQIPAQIRHALPSAVPSKSNGQVEK